MATSNRSGEAASGAAASSRIGAAPSRDIGRALAPLPATAAPDPGNRLAWRALGGFWLLVLGGAACTIATLHRLGPPEPAAPSRSLAAMQSLPPAQPATPLPPPAPVATAPQRAPRAVAPAATAPAATALNPEGAAAVTMVTPPASAAPPPAFAAALPPPNAAIPAEPPAAALAPPDPEESGIVSAALPPASPAEPLAAPPDAPPPPPFAPHADSSPAVAIPAPDPALLEASPFGGLPRVTTDGREPRQLYARPFDAAERRPRIALVIGGFGNSPTRSEEALRRLPPAVTAAFSPAAMRPDLLLAQARAGGREVLLGLPLDSANGEAGEHSLRPGLKLWENLELLHRAMGRIAGYAGVVGALGNQRGERFAAEAGQLEAVQEEVQARGLFYLDARPGAAPPLDGAGATIDLVLDEPLTRGEVERRLAALEQIARRNGSAIGLAAEPAPLLVDRIAAWAAGLEARGLVLAPASAALRGPSPSASR